MTLQTKKPMRLTFLGTGTSTGVPALRCGCSTCRSTDPADRRLRSSVLISRGEAPALLIDAGPDLRQQLLHMGSPALAAALITHIHYDHVGGIDDLRPYCYASPQGRFPVYCSEDTAQGLRHNFPYAFATDHYEGAPAFDLHTARHGQPFTVITPGEDSYTVVPLKVVHGHLPILGYRIGRLAYITDASLIGDETLSMLHDLDVLVINALRPKPHPTHFSLGQALEIIAAVQPGRAYLTHMSHDMPPAASVQPTLPKGVYMARDFATIEI